MTRNHASVAAVVITFNRRETLRRNLDAILRQTRRLSAVFVVDNASSDGTSAMLAEMFPSVTVIRMAENTGAAGGFAVGTEAAHRAGYDWLWLFNDDATPSPALLEECVEFAESRSDQRLGIVCPVGAKGNANDHVVTGIQWRARPVPVRLEEGAGPTDVDGVTFNGALVARKAFEAVGFPRPDYFMMFEEWEFCLRVRRAGFRVVLMPTHSLVDEKAGSSFNTKPWRVYYQTRNHLALALEHRSPAEVFWWACRQLVFLAATVSHPSYRRYRVRMRLKGAWDGMRGHMGRTVSPAE